MSTTAVSTPISTPVTDMTAAAQQKALRQTARMRIAPRRVFARAARDRSASPSAAPSAPAAAAAASRSSSPSRSRSRSVDRKERASAAGAGAGAAAAAAAFPFSAAATFGGAAAASTAAGATAATKAGVAAALSGSPGCATGLCQRRCCREASEPAPQQNKQQEKQQEKDEWTPSPALNLIKQLMPALNANADAIGPMSMMININRLCPSKGARLLPHSHVVSAAPQVAGVQAAAAAQVSGSAMADDTKNSSPASGSGFPGGSTSANGSGKTAGSAGSTAGPSNNIVKLAPKDVPENTRVHFKSADDTTDTTVLDSWSCAGERVFAKQLLPNHWAASKWMRFTGKILRVTECAADSTKLTIYVATKINGDTKEREHAMTARWMTGGYGWGHVTAEAMLRDYVGKHIVGVSIRTHWTRDDHLMYNVESTDTSQHDQAVRYGFVIQEYADAPRTISHTGWERDLFVDHADWFDTIPNRSHKRQSTLVQHLLSAAQPSPLNFSRDKILKMTVADLLNFHC